MRHSRKVQSGWWPRKVAPCGRWRKISSAVSSVNWYIWPATQPVGRRKIQFFGTLRAFIIQCVRILLKSGVGHKSVYAVFDKQEEEMSERILPGKETQFIVYIWSIVGSGQFRPVCDSTMIRNTCTPKCCRISVLGSTPCARGLRRNALTGIRTSRMLSLSVLELRSL